MKKYPFLLVLVLGVAFTASAQSFQKSTLVGEVGFGFGVYKLKVKNQQNDRDTTDRTAAGKVVVRGEYGLTDKIGVGIVFDRYGFIRDSADKKGGDKAFAYNFAIQGNYHYLTTEKIDGYVGATFGYAVLDIYDGNTRSIFQSTGVNASIGAGFRWYIAKPVALTLSGNYATYNYNAEDGAILRIRASGGNYAAGIAVRF